MLPCNILRELQPPIHTEYTIDERIFRLDSGVLLLWADLAIDKAVSANVDYICRDRCVYFCYYVSSHLPSSFI